MSDHDRDCARTHSGLLDHLYGALEDGEEKALLAHLVRCDACRAALREAEADRALLGEASRVAAQDLRFAPPGPPTWWNRQVRLPRAISRWGGLRIAAAAALLLAFGTLGARHHARAVAMEEFPRVVVTGPRCIVPGEPASYAVDVTELDGDGVRAQVVATASAESGTAVVRREASTDGKGRAVVSFEGTDGKPGENLRLEFSIASAGKPTRRVAFAVVRDGRRLLARVATDRPLYRPGETVRVRAVALERFSLVPAGRVPLGVRLLDPRGGVAARAQGSCEDGVGAFALEIPRGAAGGEYRVVLDHPDGRFAPAERQVLVQEFRIPRLKGDLDLDRDSYGPGDRGTLRALVRRIEGGIPDGAKVEAVVSVDGREIQRTSLVLPATGLLSVPFAVPAVLAEGRGVLSLVVQDGGVVETLAKSLPLATGRLAVELYPEGGDLVAGLPSRVYFRVRDPAGKAADLEADLVDADGRVLAPLKVDVLGMGAFDLLPREGDAYRLVARKPAGISLEGTLPPVRPRGTTLRVTKDSVGSGEAIPVTVASTTPGEYRVVAWCRGVLVAEAALRLEAGKPASVELLRKEPVGGVLRVTVLDPAGNPRAERLVAAAPPRRIDLDIRATPAKATPGTPVTVDVTARGEDGRPVTGILGAAVVDEGVYAAAGDRRDPSLPLHFLLGLEVDELERAEVYEGGPDAARAADLLLGVQGWRRFSSRDPAAFLAKNPDAGPRVEPISPAAESPVRLDNRATAERCVAYEVARFDDLIYGAWAVFGSLVLIAAFIALAKEFLGQAFRDRRAVPVLGVAACAAIVALIGFSLSPNLLSAGGHGGDRGRAVLATRAPRAANDEFMPEEAKIKVANRLNWGGVPAIGDFGPGVEIPVEAEEEALGDPRFAVEDRAAAGKRLRPIPMNAHLVVGARKGAEFREFGVSHRRSPGAGSDRADFAEVLFWSPLLRTGPDGRASFTFETSDSVTSFRISVEGHDATGRLGASAGAIRNVLPFFLEPKLPAALSSGDRLDLPVSVANGTDGALAVTAKVSLGGNLLRLAGGDARALELAAGTRGRALFRVEAGAGAGEVPITIEGRGPRGLVDRSTRSIRVVPRGFPVEIANAGVLEGHAEFPVLMPDGFEAGPASGSLRLYPSVLATLTDGVDALLGIPHGCFEQVSSTNYPNALALGVMEETGSGSPQAIRRAKDLLADGYGKLMAYECPKRGYEWWGKDPGHEVLTAYGLLEFTDMKRAMKVDEAMLDRTREWLMGKRDGQGGFGQRAGGLDEFCGVPAGMGDAYILWALTEAEAGGTGTAGSAGTTGTAGRAELGPELAHLEERARASKDPYLLALAARTLGNRGLAGAADLRRRLAEMQGPDGHLRGESRSVTSSTGSNLDIETTALATMAFLQDREQYARAEAGARFLSSARRGGGRFGATQATVLALKALVEYAHTMRRASTAHDLQVLVNGAVVAKRHVEPGEAGAIVFGDEVLRALRPGANVVALRTNGAEHLPFAFSLVGRSRVPASSPDCVVGVATHLAKAEMAEGDLVALDVEVRNRTDRPQPMTVARIGLPAGLEARTEDLKRLRDTGAVDFWETGPREVVAYFRGLRAGETKRFSLDLVAAIPGEFEAAPSSAYLYYTDDLQDWAPPLRARILPAGK